MVVCSAPGKLVWLGGYAVVYRPNVSFLTGFDKRVYAEAKESEKIVVRSPQFAFEATGVFENGKLVLNAESEKLKYVITTAEGCLNYFAWKGISVKNFELETKSDSVYGVEGSKAGLGSSAAVCVAVASAMFELHGLSLDSHREEVHKLSQWSHSTVAGKVGSGIDVAASCYGASSYVRYSPAILKNAFPQVVEMPWDYEMHHAYLPKQFNVAVAALGDSVSTSVMVKQVGAWKEADPAGFAELMSQYNACNIMAITSMKKLSSDFSGKNLEDFKKLFNHSQFLKKQLGIKSGAPIESDDYTKLRDESCANGAFVSCLPGAGGGDSIAAFCLSTEDKAKLELFWAGKGLKVLDLSVSSEGARVESA